jgi:hypothetical protein
MIGSIMKVNELVNYHDGLAKQMNRRLAECTEQEAKSQFFQLVNFHIEAIDLLKGQTPKLVPIDITVHVHPLHEVATYHKLAADHFRAMAMQGPCHRDDVLALAATHERYAKECEEAQK